MQELIHVRVAVGATDAGTGTDGIPSHLWWTKMSCVWSLNLNQLTLEDENDLGTIMILNCSAADGYIVMQTGR